jgi:hypothetical protein
LIVTVATVLVTLPWALVTTTQYCPASAAGAFVTTNRGDPVPVMASALMA